MSSNTTSPSSLLCRRDEELETFREKIHDISLVVGNVQQRFTQWFNKRNDRWGKLFGGRFDSVLVK